MKQETERREIQSVRKALSLLECVVSHPSGLSLAAVSRMTGLNRSTVFQLLNTLCSCGYLLQNKTTKEYFPGGKLPLLYNSNTFYSRVIHVGHPVLEELSQTTQETSHLAIMDGLYVRFLESVESPQSLMVVTDMDELVEIHLSSVGKAILSVLPEVQLDEILQQIHFSSITHNSICAADELRRELSSTRARGYATDDEEHFQGVRCVAAPVLDPNGNVICSIGISAPKFRIPDFETTAVPVIQAARQLEQLLCG